MCKKSSSMLAILVVALSLVACSSDDAENSAAPMGSADSPADSNTDPSGDTNADESDDSNTDPSGDSNTDTPDSGEQGMAVIDANSLATQGCQNVIMLGGYAYAACGNGIELINTATLERRFIAQAADDITGDAERNVLFTQAGNTLRHYTLADPMQPELIGTLSTNFSIFSGVAAANGILVVSAGSGGSDTQVYSYDATTVALQIDGIPVVDNRTGNPDVHVAPSANGATAFYSQDLGAVANWGIQIVEFDNSANIIETPDVVVLTPGQFTGSFGLPFGPASFPLEGELLADRLYVAHFAANGVQVIDRAAANALSLIPLGYEPANISTDGSELFVVGVGRSSVDIINPDTETVVNEIDLALQQAIGVAASATHIVVADRAAGLIVVQR